MFIHPVAIAGPVAGNLLIIGVESIEVVAVVAGEHSHHSIGLHLHIASLVRVAAIPDRRAGVIENDIVRMPAATTVIQKNWIPVRVRGGGSDVDKGKVAGDRNAIGHGRCQRVSLPATADLLAGREWIGAKVDHAYGHSFTTVGRASAR